MQRNIWWIIDEKLKKSSGRLSLKRKLKIQNIKNKKFSSNAKLSTFFKSKQFQKMVFWNFRISFLPVTLQFST